MSIKLRLLCLLAFPLMLTLSSCMSNQENQLVGVWTKTRMNALPGEYPYEQWEFTADYDVLKYKITETENQLMTTGRWGFTKRNRLSITKFDTDFNGEWQIVTLKKGVLRMVLKVFVNDQPAGQVLVEFSRAR